MESVKKILILSTSNPYRTAGIASYDLFKGFKKEEYFVKLLVENYDDYEKDIISIQNKYEFKIRRLLLKIQKRLNNLKLLNLNNQFGTIQKYTFDSFYRRGKVYSTKRILKKAGFQPDVIIIIFSQYFISYKNLKELQEITHAPIYWQFADMFPFTGGCHYAWDCEGFKSLCSNCPAYINKRFNDIPNKKLIENYEYIKDLDITAVIGSDWLIKRAQQSTLFKNKPIKKIYLSLDSNHFKSFNFERKQELRKRYEIDSNKYVILIMASFLNHKRKGINLILDGLTLLKKEFVNKKNLHLLIVGRGFKDIQDNLPVSFTYTQIEFIDRVYLPEIYNLSDLFVSASLQEVGPYTLTESLLCSIPVVSLNHGYAAEFVVNNETGILVENDLPESISKAISDIIKIDNKKLLYIKNKCRERTKSIVSKDKQIKDYIELINNNNYEVE